MHVFGQIHMTQSYKFVRNVTARKCSEYMRLLAICVATKRVQDIKIFGQAVFH